MTRHDHNILILTDTKRHRNVLDLRNIDAIIAEREKKKKPVVDILARPVPPQAPPAPASSAPRRLAASPYARLTAVALVVALNWVGLSQTGMTVSFYADAESSRANVLEGGIFDIETASDSGDSIPLASGDARTIGIAVSAGESIRPQYRVHIEWLGGDDCNAFTLSARQGGERMYRGLILDFSGLVTSRIDPWEFEFSLPSDRTSLPDGASCRGEIVFSAWRADTFLFADSGYTDEERFRFAVRKQGKTGTTTVETRNSAAVITTADALADSGGNTAGESGSVATGNATSTATATNIINAAAATPLAAATTTSFAATTTADALLLRASSTPATSSPKEVRPARAGTSSDPIFSIHDDPVGATSTPGRNASTTRNTPPDEPPGPVETPEAPDNPSAAPAAHATSTKTLPEDPELEIVEAGSDEQENPPPKVQPPVSENDADAA